MKIARANVNMEMRHHYQEKHQQQTIIQQVNHQVTNQAPSPSAQVEITSTDEQDSIQLTPEQELELLLIKMLFKKITGKEMNELQLDEFMKEIEDSNINISSELQAELTPGEALTFSFQEITHYYEAEQLHVELSGTLQTQSGELINIDYQMIMARSYEESRQLDIRNIPQQLKDPLVINYNSPSAQISQQKHQFDLDANGKKDSISMAQNGSGFLALDKNSNGQIDNGQELFGALTGDGFAELAKYDEDKNGFIDEADSVFNQLKILAQTDIPVLLGNTRF